MPTSCINSDYYNIKHKNINFFHFPRDSFVFIFKQAIIRACKVEENEKCLYGLVETSSSGFAFHDISGDKLILTAGHSCDDSYILKEANKKKPENKEYSLLSVVSKYTLIAIDGSERDATSIHFDSNIDLCTLHVKNLDINTLLISNNIAMPGDRVYNMAAPSGVFGLNLVPLFEGYYSGDRANKHQVYSLPAWSGSSGSPVLNIYGNIVGVIIGVHTDANFISFSPLLKDIKLFITDSILMFNKNNLK